MFENKLLSHIIISVLIIVSSYLLGKIGKFLLKIIGKYISSRTKNTLDDQLINESRKHITLLFVLLGIYFAIQELRNAFLPVDITATQFLKYAEIVLYIVAVFAVARFVSRLIETIFKWYIDNVSDRTQSNVSATIAPLTNKIIRVVIFLIGVIVVLDHFGINIGSLLVSLGVGSLAIALAAQDTIANMIAGFVIMLDQPYRIGDRIQLPTGEVGDVVEIGLRSTRILNFDNNYIIAPNADLIKSKIINYSFPFESIRAYVDVSVAYGTDIDKAREILLNLANQHPKVLKDPPPEVFVIELAPSGIILRLNMRTSEFKNKWFVETSIRESIYKIFQQEDINIPLPQHVVRIIKEDGTQTT